jgi:hypothetical protein
MHLFTYARFSVALGHGQVGSGQSSHDASHSGRGQGVGDGGSTARGIEHRAFEAEDNLWFIPGHRLDGAEGLVVGRE